MIFSSQFVELDPTLHDRKSFECGEKELDKFIQQFAARHRKAGISITMVLPAKGPDSVISAYYTLSHTEVARSSLPETKAKRLPRYPVPVLLIAQLAVHLKAQGKGLGKITLLSALKHCLEINRYLPSYAIVVDAIDGGLRSFYEQFGFATLGQHKGRDRLYIPMGMVEQIFYEPGLKT